MSGRARDELRARTAARLAAVQALYQIEVGDGDSEAAIAQLLNPRWPPSNGAPPLPAPDAAHLEALVGGVNANRAALSADIGEALDGKRSTEQLEIVLRAILLAGAYELRADPRTPTSVILNEYILLAQAFYGGKEPGLVNAVLDRLARRYRPAPPAEAPRE